MMSEKAEFLLETLTPVHIGSGDVFSQIDYFYENGYFNICDFQRALNDALNKVTDMDSFMKKCKGIISNKDNNFDVFAKEFNIDKNKYVLFKIKGEKQNTNIKTFIRHSNNKIYIPGSSIKGSIRTSIYLKENNILENLKKLKNKDQLKFLKDEITFLNKEKNLMVEDVEGDFSSKVMRIERIGMGSMDSAEFVEINKSEQKTVKIRKIKNLEIEDIINYVNDFYFNSLNAIIEMDALKNQQKIKENLLKIRNQIENSIKNYEKTMYLNIGFGGGYFNKSFGYYLIQIHRDKDLFVLRRNLKFGMRKIVKRPFPKTFAHVMNNQPGWVKLTLI